MSKINSRLALALLLIAVLNSPVSAEGSGILSVTFTNPTPAINESFGRGVAAVGTDKVVIGAYQDGFGNVGAAYLFDVNGALLTTFTNPAPAVATRFGIAVDGVGLDKTLIGAYVDASGATNGGAAYLFSTNGQLLVTFTNPTSAAADFFGYSVAGMGSDKVLIGAYLDDTGATNAGAAYLFSTNGTLLTSFTNPTPTTDDWFGYSVAAVDTDKVLVGAPQDDTGAMNAGAAYLMSTSGVLLTTFTNPAPANGANFGWSVAAAGSDKVLIGAPHDSSFALDVGAAYLFSTNGSLLTIFTNPTPASNDWFGIRVASLGPDKVLVSAYRDGTAGAGAGAVYLFNTNGALLNTLNKPNATGGELFGWTLAAVGNNRVLIGAPNDNTGAPAAGAAYLFIIPPSLSIALSATNTAIVSWPSPSTGWTLQENTAVMAASNLWTNITNDIQDNGATKTFVVNPPSGIRFYRLISN